MRLILKLAVVAMALLTICIRDHSSLWNCQGHALRRATLHRRRSRFRRHPDLRTVLRELPLGSHGVAVVQLYSSFIVDD